MPELPEVETVVRGLRRAGVTGMRITAVRVAWPRTVGGKVKVFEQALLGRRIVAVARRAKYILLQLDAGGWVSIHLRMTGSLEVRPATAPRERHEHVSLTFTHGYKLRFCDPRKFGRWTLWPDLGELDRRLGPEPLTRAFTPAALAHRLATRRGRLKPLLLDQTLIAGIGNIYADEALWRARLHPERRVETLTAPEIQTLHAAIRFVLRRGIRGLGTSLNPGSLTTFRAPDGREGRNKEKLDVFQRDGETCPRCRTPILRLVVAQRGTHLCPRCQPPPPQ